MTERKIADTSAAETVVRRVMETKYGDKLRSISFRKCWYSSAGKQEFWDVEGSLIWKKGVLSKETRNFRFQIDPDNGNVIGYEEITPK